MAIPPKLALQRMSRPMSSLPPPPWSVYRIYDQRTDELLYVGCTNNLKRRKREHHDNYIYRLDAVRYEADQGLGEFEALRLERVQIRELRPRDNQRLVPKRDRPEWLT